MNLPMADYNILNPTDMDELLFSPWQQAIGKETWGRINRQIRYYEYYDGKQHVDPNTGQLVKARELPRPDGLDYDPTRYATNYFKVMINEKARWQMAGKHGVSVSPMRIDSIEEMLQMDYQPSEAQMAENQRADNYEKLLYKIWKENKMREKLIQAARDRLIVGRVACKIAFNPTNGKIKWVFRPDTEVIPIYSDDDYDELEAVHFVNFKSLNNEEAIYKQTFSLEEGQCYLEEAYYDKTLKVVKEIQPKKAMGIDFIPVVLFPVNDLSASEANNTEVDDMKEQTDVLNRMNEDALDSLKFEMFSMTALFNVPDGTADKMRIAPGAVLEAKVGMNGLNPDIKKVEGGFRWKEAFKDQYARVKGALHEITSLPQIVPSEMNFGGLNSETLHVLFHDIIQETEEHWLSWGPRLEELHEKTIRYLQARVDRQKFGYDREIVKAIGDNYDNEIRFVLPLPDNRKELVELLTEETSVGFESIAGAMNRLGVENITAKKQEISNEQQLRIQKTDPYGGSE
ncbi:phage portal protein [Bacillus cereus]|uniref:phage portal protein n=1 Tax=Bacillus cereus TaxID=1396 RepID=UPI001F2A3651|nr:phage portal protein [Bacillus cereus]UIJ64463.1 phage portal protein [Bacillus cereus]